MHPPSEVRSTNNEVRTRLTLCTASIRTSYFQLRTSDGPMVGGSGVDLVDFVRQAAQVCVVQGFIGVLLVVMRNHYAHPDAQDLQELGEAGGCQDRLPGAGAVHGGP